MDASRPENAPLHKEFQWDDSLAAEEYRKVQARHIIHSIRIVTEERELRRMYFNVVQQSPNYQSINTILTKPDEKEMLLQKALRDLLAWKSRYQEIKELCGLMNMIDDLQQQLNQTSAAAFEATA